MTGFTKKSVLDRFPSAKITKEDVRGDTKLIGVIFCVRAGDDLLGCGKTPRSAWGDAAKAVRYNVRWAVE